MIRRAITPVTLFSMSLGVGCTCASVATNGLADDVPVSLLDLTRADRPPRRWSRMNLIALTADGIGAPLSDREPRLVGPHVQQALGGVAPLWGLPPEAVNIGVADYMCHMGSDSCLRHAASVEAPLIVRIGDGGIGYVGLLDGPGVFAGSDLWAELPESFMAEYHRTLEWLAFDCALEDALTNIGGGFGTEHLLSDSQIGAAELRALAECVADVSHVSPLFLQVSVCDEDPLSTGVGRTVGSRANAVLELASGVTLCPELMAADPEPVLAASHAACARRWLVALALAPDEGSHLTGWCATCRIAFQEQFYVERASPN